VAECDDFRRADLCCSPIPDADDVEGDSIELFTLIAEEHETSELEVSEELMSPTLSAHETLS
jgi:hypothetical protein